MSVESFLILLTVFASVASMFTEAIKKLTTEADRNTQKSNVIVLMVSVLVGAGGMVCYYIFNGIDFSIRNMICIPIMSCAVWLVSMLGYDKVVQTIRQIGGGA